MQPELQTTVLGDLLARFQEGDPRALDELLSRAAGRLERLTRAMLRRFPQVRQREQTADVVQEAMLSLVAALRELSFDSTREFYNLAATHIRRRLLDLQRRHAQPHRDHQALGDLAGEAERMAPPEDHELERWAALHEAVERLPAELREVFSLRLYHGWSMEEIAGLLQVSSKTVTRHWLRAQLRLNELLGGPAVPGAEEV